MASRLIFSLLFLLLTFSITTSTTSAIDINFTTFNIAPTSSPSSPPSTPPPHIQETPLSPPAHIQETRQQQQFNAIIDLIVNAGNFSNWASLLSQADPSMFPLTATLFVPEDGGNSSSPGDPLLFSYRIVPRRLTFSELRQLPNGVRLPTLLPGKTLLITSNFSVNGVVISHPDLFQSSVVSIHGIGSLLDYATFGEDYSPENVWESVPSPEKSMSPRNMVSWLVAYILVFLGLHFYRGDGLELWYYILMGLVLIMFVPVVVQEVEPVVVRVLVEVVVPMVVRLVPVVVRLVPVGVPVVVRYFRGR